MFKRFPVYLQHDRKDCGATCLRMILSHYGQFHSTGELQKLTGTTRLGVSLMGLASASEALGFRTLPTRLPYERLSQGDLPLPAILHWDQNHFVVLYRISSRYAYIVDPAQGKLRLPRAEFIRFWSGRDDAGEEDSGYVLLLEPSPEFFANEQNTAEEGKDLGYLWAYFWQHKSYLLLSGLTLLAVLIIQLLFPFLLEALVDEGIPYYNPLESKNLLYIIFAGIAALFIFRYVADLIRENLLMHLGNKVGYTLFTHFIIRLFSLPSRFFENRLTGDLLQRFYDHEKIRQWLISSPVMSFFLLLNLLAFMVVLGIYNGQILGVFLLGTLAYIGWIGWWQMRRRSLNYRLFDGQVENYQLVMQLINGMPDIKLYNADQSKRWAWERAQAKLYWLSKKNFRFDQWQKAGARFLHEGKNLLITFMAAKLVVDGQGTIGGLFAIQYILSQTNGPLNQLIQFWHELQDSRISLARMQEMEKMAGPAQADDKISLLPQWGDLSLENVAFKYGTDGPLVLEDINLLIPKGKTTAIVGTSGSGKTTLIKLLLGFYQPVQGLIRVGDTILHNVDPRLWLGKCAAVLQDGFLFSDTIANNIALGDDTVDTERLLQAVQVANIQSFVESLPLGYNTRIGSDGIGLSQGQQQRILIARAVYKNPDYLFLDEATNALDSDNEATILNNLEQYIRDKTVIVVAHRLSTVMKADQIIVIDEGRIVEYGTHLLLTRKKGFYYNLVKNQLQLGA